MPPPLQGVVGVVGRLVAVAVGSAARCRPGCRSRSAERRWCRRRWGRWAVCSPGPLRRRCRCRCPTHRRCRCRCRGRCGPVVGGVVVSVGGTVGSVAVGAGSGTRCPGQPRCRYPCPDRRCRSRCRCRCRGRSGPWAVPRSGPSVRPSDRSRSWSGTRCPGQTRCRCPDRRSRCPDRRSGALIALVRDGIALSVTGGARGPGVAGSRGPGPGPGARGRRRKSECPARDRSPEWSRCRSGRSRPGSRRCRRCRRSAPRRSRRSRRRAGR